MATGGDIPLAYASGELSLSTETAGQKKGGSMSLAPEKFADFLSLTPNMAQTSHEQHWAPEVIHLFAKGRLGSQQDDKRTSNFSNYILSSIPTREMFEVLWTETKVVWEVDKNDILSVKEECKRLLGVWAEACKEVDADLLPSVFGAMAAMVPTRKQPILDILYGLTH